MLIKLTLLKLLSRQEAISMFHVIIEFDLFKISLSSYWTTINAGIRQFKSLFIIKNKVGLSVLVIWFLEILDTWKSRSLSSIKLCLKH